ncbi:MAG: hypothetical protein RJA11_1454, partial [Bacteroidota bacterium]
MLIQAGLLLLRLIASTWRYTQSGNIPGTEPLVIAFWHEYMLPGWHHRRCARRRYRRRRPTVRRAHPR